VAIGEEGDQSKSTHVQQVIINIIHHVKESHQQSKAMDFVDIFNISQLDRNLSSNNPSIGGMVPRFTCGLTGIFALTSRFDGGSLV
jgi:hypothetical protein